jgi:hypothetical protein
MKKFQKKKSCASEVLVNATKLRMSFGLSLCLLLTLAACGKSDDSSPAMASNTETTELAVDEAQAAPMACDLISEAEMTEILGSPVIAQSGDGHSVAQTSCGWSPESGYSPYAELTIEWGSGEAAMFATGILSGIEPGLTSPFEGLGDQASAVGPTVMIRRGEDLVTIILSVKDDPVPIVRSIYATVDARL